jgi:hypothetical protein
MAPGRDGGWVCIFAQDRRWSAVDEPALVASLAADAATPDAATPDAATPDGGAPGVAGAAEVQLCAVRATLVRDAGAAGVDEQRVHSAVDQAAAALAQAPVRSFVGILVERAVREQLGLRPRPP